jgi:hypothetical protein
VSLFGLILLIIIIILLLRVLWPTDTEKPPLLQSSSDLSHIEGTGAFLE